MAVLPPAIHVDLDFTHVFMDGPIKPGYDKLSIPGRANFFTCSFAGRQQKHYHHLSLLALRRESFKTLI